MGFIGLFFGNSAEDWNLAKPLATCSLHVFRRNDDLLIQLMTDRPKVGGPPGSTEPHLFAQCHIQLELGGEKLTKPMEFWVEKVTDSSRYFVIRISDAQSGREAFIGMGFRERSDATNFKMSLQEYENALRKDQKAKANQSAYENIDSATNSQAGDNCDDTTSPNNSFSKLSLKEGEKIHINIKGKDGQSRTPKSSTHKEKSSTGKTGGLPPLLRKPPTPNKIPPPSSPVATSSDNPVKSSPFIIDTQNMEESSRNSLMYSSMKSVSSTFAVGELDDDEWGDFESSN